MSLDRRAILAASAAALAMPMAGAAAAAPSVTAPSDADLYRKLQYRTDDGLIFWWMRGQKFGVVGATLTPLFTMEVGTIQRIRPRSDGGFDVTALEMVFLSDLDTGKRLSRWRNPYTDEVLPVHAAPMGPSTTVYRPDNTRELPTQIGGARMEATAEISPALIQGDDVFFRSTSTARVFTPGRTTPFEVNDISMLHGSLKDLSDPSVKVGKAQIFFAEVTGWQRWMKMDDRPGSLTSRTAGAKVASIEEMPDRWRAMLQEVAPDVAADPVAALDRPAVRFDR